MKVTCEYAANVEKAKVVLSDTDSEKVSTADLHDCTKVETPGMKKVERVAEFLKVTPQDVIKTMIYLADDERLAARDGMAAIGQGHGALVLDE